MNFLQILFLAFLTITLTHSATKEEWKTRAIYQILTDRFHNPQQKNCPNLLEYCGGTWSGITQQLDYISNLGFNAIWISPVV
jgi:alpha-amylase